MAEPFILEVAFSDPGTRDDHGLLVEWGDGTSDRLAVDAEGGMGSATLGHAYASPGAYAATVTLSDDDGTATRTVEVTVVGATDEPAGG